MEVGSDHFNFSQTTINDTLKQHNWPMTASALTLAPLALGAAYAALCANAMSAFVRRKATWRLTVLDSLSGIVVTIYKMLLINAHSLNVVLIQLVSYLHCSSWT